MRRRMLGKCYKIMQNHLHPLFYQCMFSTIASLTHNMCTLFDVGHCFVDEELEDTIYSHSYLKYPLIEPFFTYSDHCADKYAEVKKSEYLKILLGVVNHITHGVCHFPFLFVLPLEYPNVEDTCQVRINVADPHKQWHMHALS